MRCGAGDDGASAALEVACVVVPRYLQEWVHEPSHGVVHGGSEPLKNEVF